MCVWLQRKKESRPFIDLACCPYVSAMAMDNSLDGGKPDSRAGEIRGGMEALKGAKESAGKSGIKSCAVVADEKRRRPIALGAPEFDAGVVLLRCEFPGIAKKVLQCDSDEAQVTFHLRPGAIANSTFRSGCTPRSSEAIDPAN